MEPTLPDRPALALADILTTAERLSAHVLRTPVAPLHGPRVESLLGGVASVHLKLELFQRTGTFKVRGALSNVLALHPEERVRGVVTATSGNHGIATAYAARVANTSAKIFMVQTANRLRVAAARAFGANVVTAADAASAFSFAERAVREEGRHMVHPYESRRTSLGTSTIALELMEQLPETDAVIVSVGGGGLASGLAAGIKALKPGCQVFGVEPETANVMQQSWAAGHPLRQHAPRSIADSLCAPMTLPYSFALCRAHIDDMVTVSDAQICEALALLFLDAKLAVEPSAAAPLAALVGPLRERLADRRVALVVCGANIDPPTFGAHLAQGEAALLERGTV